MIFAYIYFISIKYSFVKTLYNIQADKEEGEKVCQSTHSRHVVLVLSLQLRHKWEPDSRCLLQDECAHLWPRFGKTSCLSIRLSAESLLSIVTSDLPSASTLQSAACVVDCGALNLDNYFHLFLNKPAQLKSKITTTLTSSLHPPHTVHIFRVQSIRKTPYQFHNRTLSTVGLQPSDHCILKSDFTL